jgi:ATP-dependent DNA ligase
VVDGEIVIATDGGSASIRCRCVSSGGVARSDAKETPAAFVAFDLLAAGHEICATTPGRAARATGAPAGRRRAADLPDADDARQRSSEWLARFEGAGLDGVIAKPVDGRYQPGKRAMIKIKHARTADCVVAGFRWHKSGHDAVGSLLLGLYDDRGKLQHVGVTSAFTMEKRKQLVEELAPLRNASKIRYTHRSGCPFQSLGRGGLRGSRSGSNASAR